MIVWRRLAPAKWADAWEERLRFLGLERLVFTSPAGMKSIRIEAYSLTRKEGALLLREFGGTLSTLKDKDWKPALKIQQPPLHIRDSLAIVSDSKQVASSKKNNRIPLLIPGGMAFGTGHHATTSTCLRLLVDEATRLRGTKWTFLDIGTGSGILALAAAKLGAVKVLGMDFDPAAVRVCQENGRANEESRASFKTADILQWRPGRRTWPLVAANLFSEVLIASAPTIIGSIEPGGRLILSGIMRFQEESTLDVFEKNKARPLKVIRVGKWVTALLSV